MVGRGFLKTGGMLAPVVAAPSRDRGLVGEPYQPKVKYSPKRYSVGVDLGQAADYTAIAVLEKKVVPPRTAMFSPVGPEPGNRLVEGELAYDLVYLKRPKLGTPYDVIARRVADLICELEPQGAFGELGQVTLCVDGTGVGRGVVDMLRAEFHRRGRCRARSQGWTLGASLSRALTPRLRGRSVPTVTGRCQRRT